MLEQIPFNTFSKLSFHVGDPEDLVTCGALEPYDKTFDRVTQKNERRLERAKNRSFYKVRTDFPCSSTYFYHRCVYVFFCCRDPLIRCSEFAGHNH